MSGILESIRGRHAHYKDDKCLSNSISVALSTNKDKFERVGPKKPAVWQFTQAYRPTSSSTERPSSTNGNSETSVRLPSLDDCDEVFANQDDSSPPPRSDENNFNQKPPFLYTQLIVQAISKAPKRQELVE